MATRTQNRTRLKTPAGPCPRGARGPVYEIRPQQIFQSASSPHAGTYEASGRWLWHRPPADGLEVCLIGGGGGEFRFQDRKYAAGEGNVLVIPPREKVVIEKTSRENLSLRFFMLLLDLRAFRQIWPDCAGFVRQYALLGSKIPGGAEYSLFLPEYFPLKPSAERVAAHQKIVETCRSMLPASRIEVTALILAFMVALSRHFLQEIRALLAESDTTEEHLQRHVKRALEYIETHLRDPIATHDVAQALSLNKNYLGRIFRVATGVAMGTFILQRKMDLAKARLISGERFVKEVASGLGFQDAHYFARLFKRHIGVSPRDYAVFRAQSGLNRDGMRRVR